ncbi:MAG: hypothetical protein D6705_11255 [Deltaproteobacteria bacterium]|nr:MAG: hypothetical protein D6705_11255 [Deltaproteobacteria bacterium]
MLLPVAVTLPVVVPVPEDPVPPVVPEVTPVVPVPVVEPVALPEEAESDPTDVALPTVAEAVPTVSVAVAVMLVPTVDPTEVVVSGRLPSSPQAANASVKVTAGTAARTGLVTRVMMVPPLISRHRPYHDAVGRVHGSIRGLEPPNRVNGAA